MSPHKTYKRIFIIDFRFAPPRHLYNNHQRAMLCTWSLSSCCPPAPSAMQKNTPCILCKYTRGQDLFKQKNLAPKGLSILRRYFAIYFFKTGVHLNTKLRLLNSRSFVFIAFFYICSRASFFCSQNIRSVKKTAEKNKPISRLCQYAAGPCSITKSRKQPKGRQTTQ